MTRFELRRVFDIAADHAKLSPESRKVAWESAIMNVDRAYECYAAIARSLAPTRQTPPA